MWALLHHVTGDGGLDLAFGGVCVLRHMPHHELQGRPGAHVVGVACVMLRRRYRVATGCVWPARQAARGAGIPDAVGAFLGATHVVIGPGSWFTSVLTHIRVPEIAAALQATEARRILVLNAGPQAGETEDFTATTYLRSWLDFAPGLVLDDVVVARDGKVAPETGDTSEAIALCGSALGARVRTADILCGPGQHDPDLLADALGPLIQD